MQLNRKRHRGGIKARDKNLSRDPDFYRKLGRESWRADVRARRRPGGFAVNRELAREMGKLNGRRKRGVFTGPRDPNKDTPQKAYNRLKQRESRARHSL